MAVKNHHQLMLKKLQKQVRMLERKEEAAKKKLRVALSKIRSLNSSYKSKLASKIRVMKVKLAEAKTSGYANAAVHLERQMLKGIKIKGKALASALHKIEKKYAEKLSKSLSKKSKKSAKVKKAPLKMKKKSKRK